MPQVTTHIRLCRTNSNQFLSGWGRGQSWKISFELITSTRLGLGKFSKVLRSCQCVGHILIYSMPRVRYSNVFNFQFHSTLYFDRRSKNILGLKCFVEKWTFTYCCQKWSKTNFKGFLPQTSHVPFAFCCLSLCAAILTASHCPFPRFSIVMEIFGVDASLP